MFCKRVVPVQLEKPVSVKLSLSNEKLITNKLQVQCWLLWGWRLERHVAEFSGGDSDSTPCQLVGRELRALPRRQVQHWYWNHHVCWLCFVRGWDVLDCRGVQQLKLLHLLPGWDLFQWNSHRLVICLPFLPLWHIFHWGRHDNQQRVSDLFHLLCWPVQRVQLQQWRKYRVWGVRQTCGFNSRVSFHVHQRGL